VLWLSSGTHTADWARRQDAELSIELASPCELGRTGHQALAAWLFLYTRVLGLSFDALKGVVHAKRPKRLPVVLNPDEVGPCSIG
jgi:hypothetical protein